jgi:hypothetical protein
MITAANYLDKKDTIDWSKVPQKYKDVRPDVEMDIDLYDEPTAVDVRNLVDAFIDGINKSQSVEKPKEAVKPAVEKKPTTKAPVKPKNASAKTEKFDLIATNAGGATVISNKNKKTSSDYETIAHVFSDGKIKYFRKDLPKEVIEFCEKHAKIHTPFDDKRESNKGKIPLKPQPKGTVKIQPVVEKRFVDNFSTEFQLIKRFWNAIKDKKVVFEFRKAQLLYAAFNKAAIERKVRKTSDAAEIFNACNEKMRIIFEEFMLPTQEDLKIDFTDRNLYDKIEAYVDNVSINPVVSVLKRFIAMQNTLPEIKKAELLLKTLKNTKEKFPKSRLIDELTKAIAALQDYIKNPKEPIDVKNYGLSKPRVLKKKVQPQPKVAPKVKARPKAVKGPVNIAKTVAKKPAVKVVPKKPSLASPDVSLIDEGNIKTIGAIKAISDTGKQQSNFFKVNGAVGKFLQQVERKPFESVVITLDGMQGAGKTTTLYKFIDGFASAGNSCLFISGEEHPESALAVEKRDKYLSAASKKHTAIVGDVDSIAQLYQYVKPYDIIFIDSWQKLQRMVGNIRLDEDLRKKFNGKVFVVIFQQTTTGRTKGGAEVVFDGDIIIKMVKEASFADNYAYFDKNRYTRIPIENIRYNIATGTVYNPNAPDEPEIQQPAMPANYNTGFAFRT